MATLTAAVVLAWIVLVVLAFAMAGLLHQLRDLRSALRRQTAGTPALTAARVLPESIHPGDGKVAAAVLLVDDHCPICAEIAPVFVDIASSRSAEIDFVVLTSSTNGEKWRGLSDFVKQVSSVDAYHRLDPGWRPAVVVVSPQGAVLATEPAGSEEAVRSVIANIATATAGAANR